MSRCPVGKTSTLPGFSLLNDLGTDTKGDIKGTIRIGSLKASNTRASRLKLDIKPDKAERPHLERV
jgi:hypothetical protein